jgi:hypothetical protein
MLQAAERGAAGCCILLRRAEVGQTGAGVGWKRTGFGCVIARNQNRKS